MSDYELAMKIEVDVKFGEFNAHDAEELLARCGVSECRRLRNKAWHELKNIKTGGVR